MSVFQKRTQYGPGPSATRREVREPNPLSRTAPTSIDQFSERKSGADQSSAVARPSTVSIPIRSEHDVKTERRSRIGVAPAAGALVEFAYSAIWRTSHPKARLALLMAHHPGPHGGQCNA